MSVRQLRLSKRLVAAATVPGAVLVSGAMVWSASYSAFTATTTNPSDSWASGTVVLADDDSNQAMFTATNLKPGSTGTKCIKVTSTGSLPSAVKLYGTGYTTDNADFANNLDLRVEEGDGGGFGSCTGFTADTGVTPFTGTLPAFVGAHNNFGNAWGVWSPAGGTHNRTYRITYTLRTSAPDAAQGGSASVNFVWEAQNT